MKAHLKRVQVRDVVADAAASYLFKIISEAPFVNNLYPPPGLGITVLIDFLTELNV